MEDARLGLVLDGRYRLEKRLAAGGMGVVYRAERIGLSKPVAVKFLHRSQATNADKRERFEREAAAMSRLSHPNLVSIIDYGDLDGTPYLVMEYHKGEPLRRLLERGALPGERAIKIVRQMLSGLDSAHASGVVHRDLKPENILIVGKPGEDHVKILDFGVAKLLEGDGKPSELSVMAGALLGTAEYMSPEQVRCEVIDPRADLYAVGILLYEMVTGRRPFEAERDLAVLRMQIEDTPTPPRQLVPTISPQLEKVMMRALEKERDARWTTADEFSSALARTPEGRAPVVISSTSMTTTPVIRTTVSEPEPEPEPRRWWLWGLIGLPIAAAFGLTFAYARGLIEVPGWLQREVGSGAPAVVLDAAPPDASPPDAKPPPDAAPPIDASGIPDAEVGMALPVDAKSR